MTKQMVAAVMRQSLFAASLCLVAAGAWGAAPQEREANLAAASFESAASFTSPEIRSILSAGIPRPSGMLPELKALLRLPAPGKDPQNTKELLEKLLARLKEAAEKETAGGKKAELEGLTAWAQELLKEAGAQIGAAGQETPNVPGRPVGSEQGEGESLTDGAAKPQAEKLFAYARALQTILKAYKRHWLDHDDSTFCFIVPPDDLEAYRFLARKIEFLTTPDEDGLVEIWGNADIKIAHVKAMKGYFYEYMYALAAIDGLAPEAEKIAVWARFTSFTYRMPTDPASKPDRRIDILTESEYDGLPVRSSK